ncbi:hypothetical protein Fot_11449 [Forsythia ovata]|uniref:DUF674 family protein n=1 Tax=Forsythia ovata TaxID=205694 RepID=A0ABD1WJR4_9LAMI
MATDKETIKTTVPLKLLLDEKKTRVLAAEATSDFVDVLLSFLTLPLGTILRVTNNHAGTIGCMNNLYQSIQQLGTNTFSTMMSKSILLNPINPRSDVCKNLKLNIDDSSKGKFFSCPHCLRKRDYPYYVRCCSGFAINERMYDYQETFIRRGMMFVITDDLQVLPGLPSSLVQLLHDLGFSDVNGIVEISVDIGLDEVSKLLKRSLLSKSPLTDVFVRKQDRFTNTSLFCTIPLGSLIKLLGGKSGLGCIDILYKTVESMDPKLLYMENEDIINVGVHEQYKCKPQLLQIRSPEHHYNFLDPRNPILSTKCFGTFLKDNQLFVVSDNLIVTPSSSASCISFVKALNVPIEDIEVRAVNISEHEKELCGFMQ